MSVLLRGGRRDVEGPEAPVVAETVGEGVEDDMFEIVGDFFQGPSIHATCKVAMSLITKPLEGEVLEW